MLKITWFITSALVMVGRTSADWPADLLAEPFTTTTSDDQYDALCSGACDLAITAMDNVIGWNCRGGPDDFVILAQTERTNLLKVFARKGFRSLADLQGRNLLVDSAENGYVVVLQALMLDAGIRLGDYRMTPAGGVGQRFEALVADGGDATLIAPPFDRASEQAGLVMLADAQMSYPAIPGQGLVVRRSVLKAKYDAIARLLDLMRSALKRMRAEPAAVKATLIAGGFPPPAADILVAIMPDSLVPDRAGIELLVDMRQRLGLPLGSASVDRLVDWECARALAQ
ncbi:ABC transporter substrate-binding protein [Sphingobium sp.]|uniref:ABC transporter substrate-binding protein n=1 Tax=Sphingobium sp. TaxID=1912891 RepID=UPI0028BD57B7|nr:ABC transporter substrate-binding protein [Sphingobium sp.]